jgi:predicted amidohydrolase YtcJ
MTELQPLDVIGADLIIINGKIATIDPSNTIVEAVAVKNGKIIKVGTNDEILLLASKSAQVINLKGKVMLPGFIDSHEHVIRRGLMMDWVNCKSPPMQTIQDIIDALAAKAAEKSEGEWIIGSWFDETKLSDKRWPTRYDLDEATKTNPIYLGRAGGHNAVVNSIALEIAGISTSTPQPNGGHIDIDESGELTGRLDKVAAMNMVRDRIPKLDPDEMVGLLVENWPSIESTLLSWGITTVHEAHIKKYEALAYQELNGIKKLRIRVGLMLDGMYPYKGFATSDLARQGIRTGFGWGDKLYVIGVKIGVDGAMGSKTASLRKPYANDSKNYGINRVTQEELTKETVEIHTAGNRACIHAIGDWAIDIALNAVEEALKIKDWKNHRHRIEHAGYVRPDQLERMAKLEVAVSASIGFCHPIGDSHIAALGDERLCGYYPMRSFYDHGIVSGGNSDGFGENWPMTGIAGCVTRRTSSGQYLCKEQAISMFEAVKVYTVNGAYLEGTEIVKGSIEPGKLADFVVLDHDIFEIDPSKIIDTKVLITIVGGEVVFEKKLI